MGVAVGAMAVAPVPIDCIMLCIAQSSNVASEMLWGLALINRAALGTLPRVPCPDFVLHC